MEQPNLSDDQHTPTDDKTSLTVICIAVFLFEFFALYMLSRGDYPWGQSFRVGQAAIGGFWLACGRPRWESRLSIVAAAIFVMGMTDWHWGVQGTVVMGVAAAMVAGWTYLGRIVFSVATGEVSPHQRFSILGVMLATAVVAGMIVALKYAARLAGAPDDEYRIAIVLFHLAALGTALVTQCSVWWARSSRLFWLMVGIAVFTAIGAPLITYGFHFSVDQGIGSLASLLQFHWVADASIWVVLVPLQFALREAGTSLIAESWMQRKPEKQDASLPDHSALVGGNPDE